MYTKCIQREVTISMATKKTRKRKTSSAKKRTRTRQKDFAPFYKEIAVLVVFALFIFLFLSNFGICGYIGNSTISSTPSSIICLITSDANGGTYRITMYTFWSLRLESFAASFSVRPSSGDLPPISS